jgi:hypothetical protein
MNNFNNNQFDELTHLIKKVEWPSPQNHLSLRIAQAVNGADILFATTYQPLWILRSPLLSGLAVITALILGIGSGFASAGHASANDYDSLAYGTSSPLITQFYSGHISEKKQ